MAKQHSPGFLKIVADAKTRVTECTVADVAMRIEAGEKLLLIDVREESEYAVGHIPGAIHISKGVMERDVETVIPDPATEVILYCGGGYRSVLAADNLIKMGYTNIISMDGGWSGWTSKGLAVQKG